MPKLLLTDRFLKSAKPRPGEAQTDYFDESVSGLGFRVSEGGTNAWFHFYTSPKDGKRTRFTFASYPSTSLGAARTRVEEGRGYLEEDPPRDPRDVYVEQSAAGMTVKALIEAYLTKYVPTAGKGARKGQPLKTAKAIERRFNKNVVPIIGAVRLADLHKRDVIRVIDPIRKRDCSTEPTRCFEDIRALVKWGAGEGYLDRNPIDGMKRPAGSAARERRLTPDEVRELWNGLPVSLAKSKAVQRIIKVLLLTAQRVGEVAGMRRDELDFKANVWTIPGERTKNGYPHKVPLSDAAVAIIKEAIEDAGKGAQFVFPSPASEDPAPLPGHAIAKTITRAQVATEERPQGRFGIVGWSAHDLRRTAVSEMAELGVAPIVLGHIVNHRSVTRAGVTLAVYSQYDYAKEKREALELWAKRLEGIIGSAAAVVPMRKRPSRA